MIVLEYIAHEAQEDGILILFRSTRAPQEILGLKAQYTPETGALNISIPLEYEEKGFILEEDSLDILSLCKNIISKHMGYGLPNEEAYN